MDDVVDALGRMKNDELVRSLFQYYGLKHYPVADLGTTKGYENPQEGIELTVEDGIVTSVHMHAAGHEGHQQFRGPLPRGITFRRFGWKRYTARMCRAVHCELAITASPRAMIELYQRFSRVRAL